MQTDWEWCFLYFSTIDFKTHRWKFLMWKIFIYLFIYLFIFWRFLDRSGNSVSNLMCVYMRIFICDTHPFQQQNKTKQNLLMESFPVICSQNTPSRAQVSFEKLQFLLMVQMPPLRWKQTVCVCVSIKISAWYHITEGVCCTRRGRQI